MGSVANKYRVHEVAKDFGMTSKEITQILTDYATTPKNHMQVLEDAELNDIFEYLTQHHQAASLEELYKVPDQPKAKPQAAPAEAPKSGAAQQPAAQTQQAAQPQQQPVEFGRRDRVESGRRLVEEEQLRIQRQRPRQTGPFCHAARECGRHVVAESGQIDEPELLFDGPGDLLRRELRILLEGQRDVLGQRHRTEHAG